MKFTYLLFDADYTLLDFDAAERQAFFATAGEFGVAPTEENLLTYNGINNRLWEQIELGEVTNEQMQKLRFTRLLETLGIDGDGIAMNAAYVKNLSLGAQLMPGAIDAVRSVMNGRVIAIITNGLPSVQRPRYDASGLRELFGDTLFISGEMSAAKPKKEYFDEVCASLGIADRAEALIIGDSLTSDILGGANAGIPTCWLSHGRALGEHPAATPDYIITDVTELKELLEKIEK